jgi:chaperonin GroES
MAKHLFPLYDRIVVRPIDGSKTTTSGIVIAGEQAPDRGEVVAVGNGHLLPDGDIMPLLLEVGHEVLFTRHTGLPVKVDGEELLVFRESEILGVVSDIYPFQEDEEGYSVDDLEADRHSQYGEE